MTTSHSSARCSTTTPDKLTSLTSGGVSAGAYEVVKDAFGSGSAVEFVKVAMQPGMPQGAGRLSDGRGIITLPATRSARWCPSRCSSALPCVPRWDCRHTGHAERLRWLRRDLARRQAAVPARRL